MNASQRKEFSLNAICPYFTMFPLEFPFRVLKSAAQDAIVLDPFCGRGTTNFASRYKGLRSFGIDSSPVAVAIAQAKLAKIDVEAVISIVKRFLSRADLLHTVPTGEFWQLAYHPDTLEQIVKIRNGLLDARISNSNVVLRAIMLGALHGPLPKNSRNFAYFSNQMPRTFASKPEYSIRFWKKHRLRPQKINVSEPIIRRLERLNQAVNLPKFTRFRDIRHGDATRESSYRNISNVEHVITSPPYYGLRTYVQDQWLRNWFLGGADDVFYGSTLQLSHSSPESFAKSLAKVWDNVGNVINPERGRMVVRFGGIGSRLTELPETILRESFTFSVHDWNIYRSLSCGSAEKGKRQALTMGRRSSAVEEKDYFVRLV